MRHGHRTNKKMPTEQDPHVKIESDLYSTIRRGKHDCAFYGKWLLKAAEADASLMTLRRIKDTEFPELDRLDGTCILDFEITAQSLLGMIVNHSMVVVPMYSYEAELLAILHELHFVRAEGPDYFLSLPTTVTPETVERAIIILARTQDSKFYLHPAHLLRCRSGIAKLKKISKIGRWDEWRP